MPEESSRTLTRLDPRHPLVVDTRELGRRPGSMRKLLRAVPAPPDLGVDVLGVPAGSTIDLELRLESVMEGVLVSGSASTQVEGECVRCLDPLSSALRADLQELFVYPGVERDDAKNESWHSELHQLEGDLLDLEPVLRDAVVLALPFQPLCRVDCPGLCPQCGARLADDPQHEHRGTDPRWADLTRLAGLTEASERSEER